MPDQIHLRPDQRRAVLAGVASARLLTINVGWGSAQTFWRLVFPMSIPAIAAFATLQFLWVWNDLLIAKLFLKSENTTVIVKLQQLLGTQGQGTELLTAGAFISMIVPMIVFFSLQRFMVRGMTSGAVKG